MIPKSAATIPSKRPPDVKPAPAAPSFDIVKIGPGGTDVIAGRTAPGAEVTGLDGDKALGVATADSRSEWVLAPTKRLGPGDRVLSLDSKYPRGGKEVRAKMIVALSVPSPAAWASYSTIFLVKPAGFKGTTSGDYSILPGSSCWQRQCERRRTGSWRRLRSPN